jgi:WD40 repeat protein
LLATASSRYVAFWDGTNGDFLSRVGPVPGFVDGVAFSPTEDLLAIAATGSILYYRTDTMESLGAEQHKGVSCLAFSRDGKLLITGSKDRFEKNAKIWQVPTK